jgi:hypothetical protein
VGARGQRPIRPLLAFALGLTAIAAGCGHAPSGASSSAPSTAPKAPGVEATPIVGGGKAALLVVPRCDAAGVQVSLDVQPRSRAQATDWNRALMVVTAVSAAPCRLAGFAQLRGVRGRAVKAMVVDRITGDTPTATVTVRTGAAAFAMVSWRSEPGCDWVDGFDLILPHERGQANVAVVGAVGSPQTISICGYVAELGPFVASAELANAEASSPTTVGG